MTPRSFAHNPRRERPFTTELVATGYAYPSERVDNATYFSRAQFEVTQDREKLIEQTAMKTRAWCREEENTLTLARAAVARALEGAPALREEIDLVVVSSGTTLPVIHPPDSRLPGMGDLAPHLLKDLGRSDGVGLDVKSVYCTGFLRALEVADSMMLTGAYRAALVVSTEQGSRFSVAPSNRTSFCFLSGDAAGCAVLRVAPRKEGVGLLDVFGYLDPAWLELVGVGDDGRSLVNRGSKVAEVAQAMFIDCGKKLLERNGLSPEDVSWLIPLQTHRAIVGGLREALGFPERKVIWHGDVYGLSGSASIPSCLAEQKERGALRKGDLVMAVAVGAGLNAAGALFHV